MEWFLLPGQVVVVCQAPSPTCCHAHFDKSSMPCLYSPTSPGAFPLLFLMLPGDTELKWFPFHLLLHNLRNLSPFWILLPNGRKLQWWNYRACYLSRSWQSCISFHLQVILLIIPVLDCCHRLGGFVLLWFLQLFGGGNVARGVGLTLIWTPRRLFPRLLGLEGAVTLN